MICQGSWVATLLLFAAAPTTTVPVAALMT